MTCDLTTQLHLATDEIHLYFAHPASIQDADLLNAYQALLSPAEQTRWQRFHFAKHRHHYLVAHALLRTTLSRYATRPPQAWEFTQNRYGKPAIVANQQLQPPMQFNLSHTDGLVACAVGAVHAIGVDVENLSHRVNAVELAARILTPTEQLAFSRVPQTQQIERFFEYWTLKEAYIKARGMGLSLALDAFGWEFTERGLALHFSDTLADDAKYWQSWLLAPTPEHRGAVLVHTPAHLSPITYRLVMRETIPLHTERAFTGQILRQLR